MPRLFEQPNNTNPSTTKNIAFGGSAVITENMTIAEFITYIRNNTAATEALSGVLEIATQTEVTTGTDDTRAITPLKLFTNFNSLIASTFPVRQAYLEIGDWNMDTTDSVSIAHGLDSTKIIGVSAIIRPDTGLIVGGLTRINISAISGSSVIGSADGVSTTNVILSRVAGGLFDSANFDEISYNRGWVVIDYIL